jgi:hypothetical protein
MEDSQIRDAQTEYDKWADGGPELSLSERLRALPAHQVRDCLADWLLCQEVNVKGTQESSDFRMWVDIVGFIQAYERDDSDAMQWFSSRLAVTCMLAIEEALL